MRNYKVTNPSHTRRDEGGGEGAERYEEKTELGQGKRVVGQTSLRALSSDFTLSSGLKR